MCFNGLNTTLSSISNFQIFAYNFIFRFFKYLFLTRRMEIILCPKTQNFVIFGIFRQYKIIRQHVVESRRCHEKRHIKWHNSHCWQKSLRRENSKIVCKIFSIVYNIKNLKKNVQKPKWSHFLQNVAFLQSFVKINKYISNFHWCKENKKQF